jgi:hypothetical protein
MLGRPCMQMCLFISEFQQMLCKLQRTGAQEGLKIRGRGSKYKCGGHNLPPGLKKVNWSAKCYNLLAPTALPIEYKGAFEFLNEDFQALLLTAYFHKN